ncbi:MAG: hypothetical protein RR623_09010 [Bacilli bacterium]
MIVDKWVFYWIEFISNVENALCFIFAFLCFIVCCSMFGFISIRGLKKYPLVIIVFVIICVINTFIPTKETLRKMVIAENITHENVTYKNVDKSVKCIKDTVDYIFKKIDK